MISILFPPKLLLRGVRASALLFLLGSAANLSLSQSIDIRSPSPIRTSEVVGAIAARDLGDSRLTDHFYAFTGVPGDVLITVKSNNLNGDVDIFTAGTLRPLMKFALYAENSSPTTRAIFLRKREDLILRVEARSPNDDEGTYQIRLGGSFLPIAGDDPLAEASSSASETTVASRTKGSRRVSSVGARIEEPPEVKEEVASAPTPQPTPEDSVVPTPTPESPVTTEAPAPTPRPRRGRGRVPPVRRTPAPQPVKKSEPSSSESANSEKASETAKKDSEKASDVPKADSPPPEPRRTGRRTPISRPPPEQIPVPEPQTGPRLVIQMHDGTLIERFMSTIKRVTVENNQIVVVKKDGRIERTRLSEVLRMAIEP
jgi:hypothetical protein